VMDASKFKQRGATLIISMIFLLILSIIGLSGMEVTGLEERMAGNMRDRNLAFQSAEAVLIEGEGYLAGLSARPAFDGTDGHYALLTNGDKRWDIVDWANSSAVRSYSGPGFDELEANGAAYILENIASASDSDSLVRGGGNAVDNKRFYRITARGEGMSNTTEVILQSVYKR